jgi:hypothetical protein
MTKVWLWLSIVSFTCCSILGATQLGVMGGLAGLTFGMIVSFAALSAILASVNSKQPTQATSGMSDSLHGTHFPLSNCVWGPLSLAAGAATYNVVGTIVRDRDPGLFVPPLRVEWLLSAFPELMTTFDKVLSASHVGLLTAATLAFFTALMRGRNEGMPVSSIAWIPVLAAMMSWMILLFGLGRLAQVSFAATAVTLAVLPSFIRANDELSRSPVATGRIAFFVLEAVYASLIVGLASVIVMEFIAHPRPEHPSSVEGVGQTIVQEFYTLRGVGTIALIWLVVAVLSFVVRCAQSFVVDVPVAGDRAGQRRLPARPRDQ